MKLSASPLQYNTPAIIITVIGCAEKSPKNEMLLPMECCISEPLAMATSGERHNEHSDRHGSDRFGILHQLSDEHHRCDNDEWIDICDPFRRCSFPHQAQYIPLRHGGVHISCWMIQNPVIMMMSMTTTHFESPRGQTLSTPRRTISLRHLFVPPSEKNQVTSAMSDSPAE